MENMIEKIGLYDVAGSFCTGVVFLLLSYLIGMQAPLAQIVELFKIMNNDIINVIIFCMISYVIGLLFHELTSIIEKKYKWFDYRKQGSRTFLIDNHVIENEKELNDHIKLARAVMEKKQNEIFKPEECELYYQKCKFYAEQQGLSNQIERIDAIYTFCHTLSITLLFVFLETIVFVLLELLKLDYLNSTF